MEEQKRRAGDRHVTQSDSEPLSCGTSAGFSTRIGPLDTWRFGGEAEKAGGNGAPVTGERRLRGIDTRKDHRASRSEGTEK